MASGDDWAAHFLKRYPELSIRKPGARAMEFNKATPEKNISGEDHNLDETSPSILEHSEATALQDITNVTTQNPSDYSPIPDCSGIPNSPKRVETSFTISSPKDLIPIPKVKSGEKRFTREREKIAILTKSSYKTELEEAVEKLQKAKQAKLVKIRKMQLKDANEKNKTISKDKIK
ncbi:hypothetical protein ILUMI_00955 [Ignelater luminosus]|uniref:Uncharacterized protein n=1 Tax=Ignelater luminosus TaxID=2038154 RepID=A0A8K0DJ90_IGNLU|nr:hypothetical protein ILUMI_00955 [Ignelater luminosus]